MKFLCYAVLVVSALSSFLNLNGKGPSPFTDAAVLGVDLGSEYIKVASVKSGTPFHIVVDEQTKRKFPTVVAFDSGERYFANNGIAFSAKRPKETYQWHSLLLGNSISSPYVSLYKEEGYAYELVANETRGGAVYFRHNEPNQPEEILSTEELVAMNLAHVIKLAEADAQTPPGSVKDVVLTIPNFYTQKQRRALLDAADLAGMNVLQLIHENTAAAIQYGIDRKYDTSSLNTTHTVLFVNIGSTSTQVDLAVYTGYNAKGAKKDSKVIGQVEMKASASDPLLGGRAFERVIVDWIVDHVNKELIKKNNGASVDIRTLPRAMSKIRTAAEKAKVVLSANIETPIFLSSVHNDMDVRMHITREKFLELTAPLLDRIQNPINAVLQEENLQPSDIDAVLIIGGSVRIPAVQAAIKSAMKREYLNQSLNGDEAMVFGALFRAANLSTTFKVRPFGVIDVTPYPVGVRIADLQPLTDEQKQAGEEPFSKRASLFKKNNHVDKRKLVSFTHTRDFSAALFHDDASKLPLGQSAPIGIYTVSGLNELMANEKHQDLLKSQKPRVSLSFELDLSGLVSLPKAEATLDENVTVCVPKKKVNLTNANANATNENSTNPNSNNTDSEDSIPTSVNQSESGDSNNKTVEGEEECFSKKKTHTFKLKVKFSGAPDSLAPLTKSDRQFMRNRLNFYQKRDDAKREIAAAQNSVEAYIYSSRSIMSEDDIIAVSTEEQREIALKALEEAEEWLYEKRADDSTEHYNSKLNSLKDLVDPMIYRRSEVLARPEALETAEKMFKFVEDSLKDFQTNRPWVKEEDRERLSKLKGEASEWVKEKVAAQEKVEPFNPPAFGSKELLDKLKAMVKLTQDLLKLKKPVEKPKPKAKQNQTQSSGSGANDTDTASPSTSGEGLDESESGTSPSDSDSNSESTDQDRTQAPESTDETKKDEL